jgi:hypothetical protein
MALVLSFALRSYRARARLGPVCRRAPGSDARALEPTLPAFLALLDVPVKDASWQALEPARTAPANARREPRPRLQR